MTIRKSKIGLTTRIFVALFAGAILGSILYFIPASIFKDEFLINGVFYIAGNGFIRLMQMLVVPLVFVSIVCVRKTLGKGVSAPLRKPTTI